MGECSYSAVCAAALFSKIRSVKCRPYAVSNMLGYESLSRHYDDGRRRLTERLLRREE